jgi:hydroxymethylpyrimidine pyrophosphatase-like HAD family hydrolase
MRTVVFLDLDDTIFQTLHKCPQGEVVQAVAFRRDGTPLSFMTSRQRALLDLLFRSATVIPTTARNRDALRRVDLPFRHAAILDFGGVVLLPGGGLDEVWDSAIRPQALAGAQELHTLQAAAQRISTRANLGVNTRLVFDFEMPLYVVAKHPEGDHEKLLPIRDELSGFIGAGRFAIHSNGNNLSVVPRFLGKENAVRHVLTQHFAGDAVLSIGVGDSLSDVPFLELCDFSLLPRDCQLARRGFCRAEGR